MILPLYVSGGTTTAGLCLFLQKLSFSPDTRKVCVCPLALRELRTYALFSSNDA